MYALFVALLLALAASAAGSPAAAAAAGLGKISGKVTVAGLAPKLANLPVTRDMKTCGTSKPDEGLEVGPGGGVKNAVLWLPEGPKPRKGDKPKATLDQKQCEFTPHIVLLPAGGTLEIINSDRLFHNVHGREADKTGFNFAMPVPNHIIPKAMKEPGLVRVTCDVHPWMRAWVDVLPTTAFALTDESGSYTIADVPPGKYKLKLWHERLGEKQQDVEVTAGGTSTIDLLLTPR